MRLLYGTFNPAKFANMRKLLSPLPVELCALSDLAVAPPEAVESGANPLENARIKAIAYCKATGMTTLSADSGLYLDGLPPERQPGEHARRAGEHRMDDEEMLAYYAALAASLGGRAVARYRNALCIAFTDGRVAECFDDSIASPPFYLVSEPHPRRTRGFPLDSISVEIDSGKYYYDLEASRAQSDLMQMDGYIRFISRALGLNAYEAKL